MDLRREKTNQRSKQMTLYDIPYSALGKAMNSLQELAEERGLTDLLQDIVDCKNMTESNLHQLQNL